MYTIIMKYGYWGGVRSYRAVVTLTGWGLLYMAHRSTAKAAYRAAQRAIRAYTRYGNVHYNRMEGLRS